MKTLVVAGLLAVSLNLAGTDAWGQRDSKVQGGTDKTLMARGKYIVEDLAACGQCHTPRNSQGELDRDRPLQGAPLWLQPSRPNGDWPLEAPRLAGIRPGSDEQIVKLLTTGIWRDGKPLRPPMPQFRMTPQDAQAVVAYLRSLNPPPK